MCLIYFFTMKLIYTEARIDEKQVDLEFTTLSDFTVQGDISYRMWNKFKEENE